MICDSSPPPASSSQCSEHPPGVCRERGPGALSDRSYARLVKCGNLLGVKKGQRALLSVSLESRWSAAELLLEICAVLSGKHGLKNFK